MVTEALSLKDVSKGFSRGGEWTGVLADVSFTIGRGEIVAIVGGRLAGKTTLLKIAAGMECPDDDEGSVSLGSQRLAELGERSRSRLLGGVIVWIDRNGPELDVEVSRFVGWPLALHGHGRQQAEQTAVRTLQRVGAGKCVGRRWRELSDGQRVLVGLARAFVGNPRVVIIDDLLDALWSLDSDATSDLLRSLIEECKPPCGVLLSVSDVESKTAIVPDRAFSLTPTGTLKPLSGRGGNGADGGGDGADVIPFSKRAGGRGLVGA